MIYYILAILFFIYVGCNFVERILEVKDGRKFKVFPTLIEAILFYFLYLYIFIKERKKNYGIYNC